jgi:hypothetical protein
MNYSPRKVIGDDETGFRGTDDAPYRMEGWDFIIAGGALYNNLDYSFAAGYEDGTFAYPPTQPGGGNPGFRRQMKILRDFIHGFDFVGCGPTTASSWAACPWAARCGRSWSRGGPWPSTCATKGRPAPGLRGGPGSSRRR